MAGDTGSVLVSTFAVMLLLAQPMSAGTVTLPNGIDAATVSSDPVKTSPSALGDNPTISRPDQVFSGTGVVSGTPLGITTGANEGEPVVEPTVPVLNTGRKMLQVPTIPGTLHLTGNGVSAGDKDLGAQANAYGQAQSNGVTDTHIQPHGVQAAVSADGTQHSTNIAANPDCAGKEGSCVTVEPGKR